MVKTDEQTTQLEVRKNYESPRLIEWGSLRDLTHGPNSGLQDVPNNADGGSEAE